MQHRMHTIGICATSAFRAAPVMSKPAGSTREVRVMLPQILLLYSRYRSLQVLAP